MEALEEVESDEEEVDDQTLNRPAIGGPPMQMRMKISCWNMNLKTYRKKLPLEFGGKKEKEIYESCGINGILMVNRERTSALTKNLESALSLAEFSLFR